MYTLMVGLEHLQSLIEFKAQGNITFQRESPTIFLVWSFEPFTAFWTVIDDMGRKDKRTMEAVERGADFSPEYLPYTLPMIRNMVSQNNARMAK